LFPVGAYSQISFAGMCDDHFNHLHEPKMLDLFNTQSRIPNILYSTPVDVRAYKVQEKRVHNIHYESDERFIDPDMLEEEDLTAGLYDASQFFQTPDRGRHRAEDKSRNGRIERIFGKWKRLNITFHNLDRETKLVGLQSSVNQHPVGDIETGNINALRIVRKVFPGADPNLKNLPPGAGKQSPTPAAEGSLGDYLQHIIVWSNSVVARFCLRRQIAVYLIIHVFFAGSMILPA